MITLSGFAIMGLGIIMMANTALHILRDDATNEPIFRAWFVVFSGWVVVVIGYLVK